MSKRVISAYTPSNTDPETRKRIFVQRHKLLDRVVRWCEESMLTGNKHHLLFVGPRGSGKTHLVSMVKDRLVQPPRLADKMRIAWLGEDNVFTGLIDVALEIADELSNEYPEEFEFDYRSHAGSLVADEAAEAILDEVIRRAGDKSILLIMENLDRAFHGLGDLGQKKWRAFLQETGRIATLATSQQLFEGISSRDAAFYGFFEIIHLEPLSVEDARQLMANIARENKNSRLTQFMATSEGRYRVRALQHLAGGNHRMYVMLSEFLTKESLDGLVEAFEELAEDLTPYFQERVRSLSPQQARIVQSLCNASGAITVKEVAKDTFIAERNVSKQLGELKQKRYVISEKRGKESYYEMAEPLMRLCLEVKKQRGKPLKLVAAFLRAWYSANSIDTELQSASQFSDEDPRTMAYKQLALESNDTFQDVIRQKLDREFEAGFQAKDFVGAMNLAEELVYADRPTGLTQKSRVLRAQGQLAEALNDVNEVLSLPDLTPGQKAAALVNRGVTYGQLGDSEKAIADYSAVIEMAEAPVDQKAMALFNRGVTYGQLGDSEKAIADCSAVIEMAEAPVDQKAMALFNRGFRYGQLGDSEKAIADYSAVIEMAEAPVDQKAKALVNRGVTYGQLGDSEKEIADYSAVIEMAEAPVDRKAQALFNRGVTYGQLGDSEREIADYSAVIEMAEAPFDRKAQALFNRGFRYGQLGDSEKAIADYSAVIEMAEAPVDRKAQALFNRGFRYGQLGDSEKAIADYSAVIEMAEAPVDRKAQALFNRGVTYGQLGDSEKAIADYSAVIEMSDTPVDTQAVALNRRGAAYWHADQFELALNDFVFVSEMTGVSSSNRAYALFCIPEAMILTAPMNESITSIQRAFAEGDSAASGYGGTPRDILKMILRSAPALWPEFVDQLIPIYAQYDALNSLGSGLTESIAVLDAGDFSESQLELWNAAWTRRGAEYDQLSIPLAALDAAIEVIKTGSDRPLFGLPQEIRKIVQPLLKNTLAKD